MRNAFVAEVPDVTPNLPALACRQAPRHPGGDLTRLHAGQDATAEDACSRGEDVGYEGRREKAEEHRLLGRLGGAIEAAVDGALAAAD